MVLSGPGQDPQNISTTASLAVCGLNRTEGALFAHTSFVFISGSFISLFRWISYSIVCNIIDVFGTVTNILNIVCFVRQGFQDSVNISLLGLAISDLCSLVTLVITNVCYNPAFDNLDLNMDPIEFQYLTGAWPHVVFTRVTSWITAFITLERCMCITMPLKIKTLLSPARVTAVIVCIYIVLIASVIPVYYANRLQGKFSPERNRTILGLVYTTDRNQIEAITYIINNVFLQFGAFGTVIICTVTLALKLQQKSNWRTLSTDLAQAENLLKRDKKVIQMVIVISGFFIACFTPLCIVIIAMLIVPQFSFTGEYRSVLIVVSGLGFLLESANSSVNIFIYYHMSSKYRETLQRLCSKISSSQNVIRSSIRSKY